MKYLACLLLTILVGCSTDVPLTRKFPNAPEIMLQKCPNLDVLSKFAQMKAMANEEAENGKVQVAIGPLTVTPAFVTLPASWSGKKL